MHPVNARAALGRRLLAALLLWSAATVHADVTVPSGATFSLGGGTLDLGCGDLSVGGYQQVDSGSLRGARNVTVQPGGTLDGGSGQIALVGNWSNDGSFNAGSGRVAFSDNAACASASSFAGTNTFASLSLVSSLGKTYTFPAGLTQTVLSSLQIMGLPGTPLRIVSSVPGQQANLYLAPGASQNIQDVSVTDNYGTGQVLAPTQHNEGGGGKVRGWFGIPLIPLPVMAIPTLDMRSLALLCALIGMLGLLGLPRREWRTAPRDRAAP